MDYDSDYRGEIKVILINLGGKAYCRKGTRIAQMVLCPIVKAKIKEVEALEETKRPRRFWIYRRKIKMNLGLKDLKDLKNRLF